MKLLNSFLLFSVFISFNLMSYAQHNVGTTTIIYQDPDRDNREIQTIILYPATATGTDTPIADGVFHAVVFGHGFSMAESDLYQYIWDAMVPLGYIFLFPTTEGGGVFSSPNHEAFGLDLKFLNSKIKLENNNSESIFYQKIAEKTAIMGYSMGGKAAYIASANNSELSVLISLAAAMSDFLIGVGYNAMELSVPFVSVPTLVVDAEFDCVVPEAEGHQLIYDALNSYCKNYVNILGGGHCYFASYSSVCEQGENLLGGDCASSFTITREEQNQTVIDIITPYLDYWLRNNQSALDDFNTYISTSDKVTSLTECDLNAADTSYTLTISTTGNGMVTVNGITYNSPISFFEGTNIVLNAIPDDDWEFIQWSGSINETATPTSFIMNKDKNINVLFQLENSVVIQESANKITLYPNPAKNIVNISSNNSIEKISVYDILGKNILTINPNNSKSVVNINDLNKGLYFIKVKTENGSESTHKLVKE
ncbi:MAG TPA: T9SS type A sorting domain-containing protein [Bacteroidales bacterium]|nr:T9SS type A sorting domain-containing protein [Bacteroidales bacterium]HPL04108.1 T9SS type A sorting domain-containing protein [Bacteroidales bacterium]